MDAAHSRATVPITARPANTTMADEAIATRVLRRAMQLAEHVPPYYDNLVATLKRTMRGEGFDHRVAELIDLAGSDPAVLLAAQDLMRSSSRADAPRRRRAAWLLDAALEQVRDLRGRQSEVP